ncbi:MAG: GNAT family N-acetyltransferase [Bryobacteraceae bacterium]|jgi:GNAT superfamily N-acetyltransferase
MPHSAWNIRPARISDARAIAEVHVESWRSTYAGIFSDALLSGLSVDKRELSWREILTAEGASSGITRVGCDEGGNVVGFVSGGKERTGKLGCEGELYAIYLREQAQRKGLGTLLVRQFVGELEARGFRSMAVWVLALNPSRRFYECLGGKEIGQQQIEQEGHPFVEVAYGWQSFSDFPR